MIPTSATSTTDLLRNYQQPGLKAFSAILSQTSLPPTQAAKLLEHLDQKNILFVAYAIAKNSLAPGQEKDLDRVAQNLIPILQSAVDLSQRELNLSPEQVVSVQQNLGDLSQKPEETKEFYQQFEKEYPEEQTKRPENYESSHGGSNPLLDHVKNQADKAVKKKVKEIWENFKKSPTGKTVKTPPTPAPAQGVSTTVLPTTGTTVTISTGEDAVLGTAAAAKALTGVPQTITRISPLNISLRPTPPIPVSGAPPPPVGAISGKIVGFSVNPQTSLSGIIPREYMSFGILKQIPATEAVKNFGLNMASEGTKFFQITEKGAMLASKIPSIGSSLGSYIPGSAGITTLVSTPTSTIAVSGISTSGGVTIGTATTIGTTGLTTIGTTGLTAVGTTTATAVGTTAVTTTATAVGTTAVTTVGTAAVTTAATTTAAATTGVATGATVGAAAGGPTPVAIVTAIIGAIIGLIAGLIPSIYKKFKDYFDAIVGATLVIIFGSFAGLGFLPALALGGMTGGFMALTNTSIVGAISGLGNSLVDIAKGVSVTTAVAFFLAAIILPAVVAIIIFFINTGGYVTPQAPVSFFDPGGGFADPTSCPILGGYVTWGSYDPTNENSGSAGGHGSNSYWSGLAACSYALPQSTGCMGPNSNPANICYGAGNQCTEYGYAADIHAVSGTPVYLPLVDGQPANWSCHRAFQNPGGAGFTIYCDTSDGNVHLVLTHVNDASPLTNVPSGTQVSTIDWDANPHLHMEAQVGGVWVRPENYFCGGT